MSRSVSLGSWYHAASAEGETLCDHRHMRRAEADACADRIAAGLPEHDYWAGLAADSLQREREIAGLAIEIDLWQGLLDRIDTPTPQPPPTPTRPDARPPAGDASPDRRRPRPVSELFAWSGSSDAAFYYVPGPDGDMVPMLTDPEEVALRARYAADAVTERAE